MISFGPAAFVALVVGARRGVWWAQPAVVLTAWLLVPMAYLSTSAWLSELVTIPSLSILTTAQGFVTIVFVAWVVEKRQGLWLPAALWAMHILLIGSSFGYGNLLIPVLLAYFPSRFFITT